MVTAACPGAPCFFLITSPSTQYGLCSRFKSLVSVSVFTPLYSSFALLQINFRCKPSFRESGSRNYREVSSRSFFWQKKKLMNFRNQGICVFHCDPLLQMLDKFRCKIICVLLQPVVVHHHWVHRRRQEGKCKQCGKVGTDLKLSSESLLFIFPSCKPTRCRKWNIPLTKQKWRKLNSCVHLRRASSKSLLSTVKRLSLSAAPGANRPWVCF